MKPTVSVKNCDWSFGHPWIEYLSDATCKTTDAVNLDNSELSMLATLTDSAELLLIASTTELCALLKIYFSLGSND